MNSKLDWDTLVIPPTRVRHEDGSEHFVPQFMICRSDVTIRDFAQFADATGYKTTAQLGSMAADFASHYAISNLSGELTARHPAVMLSWWDATAYCSWANGRLATQSEWLAASVGEWTGSGRCEADYADALRHGPGQIEIAGPEWTSTCGAGDTALVRNHPRYVLSQNWAADPSRNRLELPKDFYNELICFRVCFDLLSSAGEEKRSSVMTD